jgi:hypothetical protein
VGTRHSSGSADYFFLVEPLLPELDFDELLFELAVVFFDPLELPDLVGIRFLPSGAVEPPSGSKVSDRHPRVLPRSRRSPIVLQEQIGYERFHRRCSAVDD